MKARSTVITIIVAFCLVLIALFSGYHLGIHKATTSDGWLENDEFVLEVDGQIYAWEVGP